MAHRDKGFDAIISELRMTSSLVEQCKTAKKEQATKSRLRCGRISKNPKASTSSKRDSGIQLDSAFQRFKDRLIGEIRSFQTGIRNSVQVLPGHSLDTSNLLSSTLLDHGIPNEYEEDERTTFIHNLTDTHMSAISQTQHDKADVLQALYRSEMTWLDEFLAAAKEELLSKKELILFPKTPSSKARTKRLRKSVLNVRRSSIVDPATIKKPKPTISRTSNRPKRAAKTRAEESISSIAESSGIKKKPRRNDSTRSTRSNKNAADDVSVSESHIEVKSIVDEPQGKIAEKAESATHKTTRTRKGTTKVASTRNSEERNEPSEVHNPEPVPKKIKKFSALPHVLDKIKAFERFSGSGKKNSDKKQLIACQSTPTPKEPVNAKRVETEPECSTSKQFNSTATLMLTLSKVFKPSHQLLHTPRDSAKKSQKEETPIVVELFKDTQDKTPTTENEKIDTPATEVKNLPAESRTSSRKSLRRQPTIEPLTEPAPSSDFLAANQNNTASVDLLSETVDVKEAAPTVEVDSTKKLDDVSQETIESQVEGGVRTRHTSAKHQRDSTTSQKSKKGERCVEKATEIFDADSSLEELKIATETNKENRRSSTRSEVEEVDERNNSLEPVSKMSTRELFDKTTNKADQSASSKEASESSILECERDNILKPSPSVEKPVAPNKPERPICVQESTNKKATSIESNKDRTEKTSSNKEKESKKNPRSKSEVIAQSPAVPLRVTRSKLRRSPKNMRTELIEKTTPELPPRTSSKTSTKDKEQIENDKNVSDGDSDVFVTPPAELKVVESKTITKPAPSKALTKHSSQSTVNPTVDSTTSKAGHTSTQTLTKHESTTSVGSTGSQSMRITRSKMRQPKQAPPIPTEEPKTTSQSPVENVTQKAVKPITPVRNVRSQSPGRTVAAEPGTTQRGRVMVRKFTPVDTATTLRTSTSVKRKPMPRSNSATETKRARTSSGSSGSKLTNTITKAASSSRLHGNITPNTNKTSAFINALLNGKSRTPATASKTLTSFIKRATPKKQPTQEELAEEKKRNYMVKMEAERARLEQAEKERLHQLEAKKQQRMERMNKAKEAREARRQNAVKKQEILEQRMQAAEKKQQEEKEKAAARDQKLKEAEEKRKKEEQERKARIKQQEMEAELLRKKQETEELAAKRARFEKEAKENALNKINEQRILDHKTPLHNQTKSKVSIYTSNSYTASKQSELSEDRSRLINTVNKLHPNKTVLNQKPVEDLNKTFDMSDDDNFMDIKEIDQDDEFDDEKFKQYTHANFTQKSKLQMALLSQRYKLKEEHDYRYKVIGYFVDTPDLSSVFKRQRPRFFKRTSSAHWPSQQIKYIKK